MSFYTQPQGAHRHPVLTPWLDSALLPLDFCFLPSALSFTYFQPLTDCPRLATLSAPLSFQQVTTIKWNYPTRIVHPERTGAPGEPGFGSLGWGSEGSLCEPEADTTKIFVLLSFQRVTTINFCNSFLLITIQIAPGWVGTLNRESLRPTRFRMFFQLPYALSSVPLHSSQNDRRVRYSFPFSLLHFWSVARENGRWHAQTRMPKEAGEILRYAVPTQHSGLAGSGSHARVRRSRWSWRRQRRARVGEQLDRRNAW
jgi:hypothetical protein